MVRDKSQSHARDESASKFDVQSASSGDVPQGSTVHDRSSIYPPYSIGESEGIASGSVLASGGYRVSDETAPQESPVRIETGSFRESELVANRFRIIKRLGRGGFGAVYRAYDEQLQRDVAIKRSHDLRTFVAGRARSEARTIASLSHPGIVSIFDMISVSNDELLIVMECLEGATLYENVLRERLQLVRCVEILAEIAAALTHAHARKIVHSDLKPSNVFIEHSGRVRLLDFGLAVALMPGEDPEHIGGTPGYMAPEQIRGESHRIDGRADIFAIGVIGFELLAGTRPFVGKNRKAIFDATVKQDPPPIRQLNAEIDVEMQRIIGRCLEKRMSDRYDSVSTLLEDLAAWLKNVGSEAAGALVARPRSAQHIVDNALSNERLANRGLFPFTEEDSSAYLPLVPGPRDRHGIPMSIRFWQRWVDSNDPDTHFPVGVLYGPSGSGKTSYLRAGLLPQLSRDVRQVYVECRPGNLGERVSRIIQSKLQQPASDDSSLRELLTRLRSTQGEAPEFRLLLIVLDQFEAWSQYASLEERQEFADALRQCDGIKIRAILSTRDDHWLDATELLRWLEVPVQEGRNIASVDLLDAAFARDTLERIGRAMGRLPDPPADLSAREKQFLLRAVDELAQRGKIICAHLVMFAQMMRYESWEVRSLRSRGGVAGACSLFLQEMFSETGGHSPQHRRVAPAVRLILNALLPTAGDSVAATIVSKEDLEKQVDAGGSGYVFDDAMSVLIDELHIVTTVDPEPPAGSDTAAQLGELTSFRISHDFLVLPVSLWLDRHHKRTWRGRVRSRLKELSETWANRPAHSMLPGYLEYLTLLLGSSFGKRSELESNYLKAATRLHAGRISVSVLSLLAFLAMTGVAAYQREVASGARQRSLAAEVELLINGPPADILTHIAQLTDYGREAVHAVEPWAKADDPRLKLPATLFLESQRERSFENIALLLADAPAELFGPILDFASSSNDARERLTEVANNLNHDVRLRRRAAILLLYLGETEPVIKLLGGSTNYLEDSGILLETTRWRGAAEPWIGLLRSAEDPEVRYHTMVLLSTYLREQLQDFAAEIDIETLGSSPSVKVYSASRFLAAHLGMDAHRLPLAPPDDADWRVIPDRIAMAKIHAGSLEFSEKDESPDLTSKIEISQPFWMAVTPVRRELYSAFLQEVKEMENGQPPDPLRHARYAPRGWRTSPDEPVIGIKHASAISFCNWLSQRHDLKPCYRFDPQRERKPKPGPSFRSQRTPWEFDASADGYRLPSFEEYQYVARCGYELGRPWSRAKALAEIGGDYSPPSTHEYCRRLFSLMPNRFGFFVNDDHCGSWAYTDRPGYIDAVVFPDGSKGVRSKAIATIPSYFHSIFLVQSNLE